MNSSKAHLKLIYSDIIRGFSSVNIKPYGDCYIKHFNSYDSADFDSKHESHLSKAIEKGLSTYEEQEKQIIADDLWSEKTDKEVKSQKSFVRNLYVTKSKLWQNEDITRLDTQIKEAEKKIQSLEAEKNMLIGLTAEMYASKKLNEYYIYNAYYKDSLLKERLFTEEEYDELDELKLGAIMLNYGKSSEMLSEKNIKQIAISPFFVNFFNLCGDNIKDFFGKAIIELTFYQFQLATFGRYFKSILSNAKVPPPDDILDDPEKLAEWCMSSNNAADTLQKASNGESSAVSLVGASQEDLKKAGIKPTGQSTKFYAEALKKGGELSMQDLMRLEGVK